MNPDNNLIADNLLRLIIQEVLFLILPVGHHFRLILSLYLKHLSVQPEIAQAFSQRIIHS